MTKRKQPTIPEPQPAIPARFPVTRGGTYLAVQKASDRYLAKAEEAMRNAALLWNDVDSGLERQFEELAVQILAERRLAAVTVTELYGDRLREGVF